MNKKHNRFRANMSKEQVDQLQGTEIKSKRTRFSKVFALGGNRFQAVTYTNPVHRFNDKTYEWDELDNRFSATSRLKEAQAAWKQGIMPAVEPGEILLECKTGAMDVACAMSGEVPFIHLTNADGHRLSWGIESAVSILPETSEHNDVAARNIRGMREKVLERLHGEVVYAGIFAGVDLRCKLDRGFKDELIFAEKESVRPITFLLESEGRPMELNDENMLIVKDEQGDIVFRLQAPFMVDANEQQGEAAVQLEARENGVYAMTCIPDAAFVETAAFPLVLDPAIESVRGDSGIEDTYVQEGSTANNSSADQLWVTDNSTYGKRYAFLRVKDLPAIGSNHFITDAQLYLYGRRPDSDIRIMCAEVTGPDSWSPSTITFANQPDHNPLYQDYCTFPADVYAWRSLDVTTLARKWYLGDNQGVVLLPQFDYPNTVRISSSEGSAKPYFVVNYASLAGLESYLSYDGQSAGLAGAGSVSLVNGNMIFAHNDTAMDGNRMPVSVTHYYNSCNANMDEFGLGYGWRTSVHQTMHKEYINGEVMYVYTDGDGTEHWFELDEEASTTQYVDLSGLSLTLTVASDGKITVTSKGDGRMVFPAISATPTASSPATGKVLVKSIHDAVGNQVTVTARSDKPLYVSSVTDGAGRVTSFVYAAQSDDTLKCTAIKTPWQTDSACTRFTYTSGNLTKITHEDNRVSNYQYTTRNGFRLLAQADGADGMKVKYTYSNTGAVSGLPHCVTTAQVTGTNNGTTLTAANTTYSYGNHLTLVKDNLSGKTLRYHFNDNGNQISIDDGLGYAVYTEYDQSGENSSTPINHATTRSRMQRSVKNLLLDPLLNDNSSVWVKSSTGVFTRDGNHHHLGAASYRVTVPSDGQAYIYQSAKLTPGKSYTLSAYLRSNSPQAFAWLGYTINGGSMKYFISEPVPIEENATSAPFTRTSVSFTLPADADSTVYCGVNGITYYGTYWFDSMQLEEGLTCNHFNMLQNSDFKHTSSSSTVPTGWTLGSGDSSFISIRNLSAADDTDDTMAPELLRSGKAARLAGRYDRTITMHQDIPFYGYAGDRFSAGGWCKSFAKKLNENNSVFCCLEVYFTGGSTWYRGGRVNFNYGEEGWQFASGNIVAPYDYTKIRFTLSMICQINHADFTGLYLYPESFGTDYVYDANGNRKKAIQLYGGTQKTEYDDHDNMTKYTAPGQTKSSTFSYGTTAAEQKKHLLLESLSPLGTAGQYSYDAYGNATRSDISGAVGSTTAIMRTTSEYQHNGNYVHKQTDARGKTVTTVVDANKGTVSKVTDPKGQAVNYSHDTLRRVVKVSTTDSSREFRNEYTYDQTRGLLTGVKHNTDASTANDVSYTFEYDALGRKTKVKVGGTTLSTNVYQNDATKANYGTLSQMQYGNGAVVKNEYDDFNRLIAVKYNSATTPRYEYAYNANGQVARVTNNQINMTTKSLYDRANRPCRTQTRSFTKDESGTVTDESHLYTANVFYDDTFGRLTEFKEYVGAGYKNYGTSFGYDAENRPTSLSYGTYGKTTVTYDGLGRVAQTTVKAGNYTTNTNYTYTAGATLSDASGKTSTSGLVASLTLAAGSWSYPYTYTYDANGNITKVVQSGVTTSYTYDALGQLTRVDDGHENATWLYTYDQGGNILTKKKYALGVSSGTPVESKTFTYGNSSWKDQLTAVNGVAITYDAIGNPLNDGTWSYTWSNGRQLTRMTSVDKDVRFVYNENGLRVQKRVDGVATNYYLHGKNVVHMTRGSDELHFFYDAQNKPAVVVYNGTAYAYLKNLQGDIVAILNGSGNAVVSYVYDAWGRPVSKTGSMASTLGTLNPFRYRSYVYDEETGLYYLRSRYYNPTVCRFINEDILVGNINLLSTNMFTYCLNRPVLFVDRAGTITTSAHFAMCLHVGSGGGAIDVEDDKYYEFVIIGGTSCTLRDEYDNSIGTVYANAKGGGERLRYIGKATANGTKLMINSEYGEGTVDIAYCYPLQEVDYSYYTFSAFDLGAEDCYADWPIINAQYALVEWRASVDDPSVPPYTADDVDGSYGPTTKAVMKAFQKAHGLSQDGYLGEKTKPELIKYYPFDWKYYAP